MDLTPDGSEMGSSIVTHTAVWKGAEVLAPFNTLLVASALEKSGSSGEWFNDSL